MLWNDKDKRWYHRRHRGCKAAMESRAQKHRLLFGSNAGKKVKENYVKVEHRTVEVFTHSQKSSPQPEKHFVYRHLLTKDYERATFIKIKAEADAIMW